jgi:hypothetical protein
LAAGGLRPLASPQPRASARLARGDRYYPSGGGCL